MAQLEWLNQEFLEECLSEEVADFSTSMAVPPGNNYGSCVIRVTVKLKKKEVIISLIVKSELTKGLSGETVIGKSSEHYFYYSFIPEAEKIAAINFVPKTFPSPRPYTVILEDLREQGYSMGDRIKQLDFDHCKLYMTAAAEFHAVSYVVNKKNLKVLERFKETDKGALRFFKAMLRHGIACFIEYLEKEKRFKRVYEIVNGLSDSIGELLVECYKPRGGLNSLNQLDPWTTNMMFRYNEREEACDIRLLDFQALKVASPIHDLIFFIWSSANNDVRNSNIIDLFEIYLERFNKNLSKYGCSEFLTREELRKEVKRLSPQVLFVVSSFLPLVLDTKPIDFASILNHEKSVNPYRKVYNELFCKVHLPQVISQMEKMGVIDYLESLHKKNSS